MPVIVLSPYKKSSAGVTYVGSSGVGPNIGSTKWNTPASFTVPKAANVQDGDLMLYYVTVTIDDYYVPVAVSTLAGWTMAASNQDYYSINLTEKASTYLFYKVASNEPASYTWNVYFRGGSSTESTTMAIYSGMVAYRGVTQVQTTTTFTNTNYYMSPYGSQVGLVYPSITTTAPNQKVVTFAKASYLGYTPPTQQASRYSGFSTYIADETVPVAFTATGNRIAYTTSPFSSANGQDQFTSHVMVLLK